jgi:hypothetical protein
MSRSSRHLLRTTLRDLHLRRGIAVADWDLLLRQARRAGLLGRLAYGLKDSGLIASVPREPRQYLEAECVLAEKHARDVRWEVRCIKAALAALGIPIILLKGAAYTIANLPTARGRLFSDIDVLVPFDSLGKVEKALKQAGWYSAELAPYDERYYRRWMHQIPPMSHYARWTTIDVHHTIVARTARHRLDAAQLFVAAVPVPGDPDLKILAPTDMVLHSATHLLNEGDFDRGLRDLDDLHLLLSHFAIDPAFWPALLQRAAELGLQRPLYYALRYAAQFLGTAIPEAVREAAQLDPPGALVRELMDRLFDRGLRPHHASCRDGWSGVALELLYIRGHLLLMPPHVLVPHLLRKAYMRVTEKDLKAERRPGLMNPR